MARPAPQAPARVSILGVFLTAALVILGLGSAAGAGYWFYLKPQADRATTTLVSLDLTTQDLSEKLDAVTARLDGVDGGVGGAGGVSDLARRLDALEAAQSAMTAAVDDLRRDVIEPMAATVSAIRAGGLGDMAAMAPTASAMIAERQEDVIIIPFKKVGDTGGAWLGPVLASVQQDLRDIVGARDACTLHISGHADRLGPAALNERIGFRRAERVRDGLAALFVTDDVLKGIPLKPSVSLGERDLAVSTDDNVADARNRRVEIHAVCGVAPEPSVTTVAEPAPPVESAPPAEPALNGDVTDDPETPGV